MVSFYADAEVPRAIVALANGEVKTYNQDFEEEVKIPDLPSRGHIRDYGCLSSTRLKHT
jgi:hypothetical protein